MPELPRRKVGLVSCSGEELPGGTITRLATRKVLESLRPDETVTICLPLFLAGGEGDRAFARHYPTISIDGCEKRCAALGTEYYSSKPVAGVVVSAVCPAGPEELGTARRLSEAGFKAVDAVAAEIAGHVDRILRKNQINSIPQEDHAAGEDKPAATCSCGSGIAVQVLQIDGRRIEVLALPLIFNQFREAGKKPGPDTYGELMEFVRLYNSISESDANRWRRAVELAYNEFCAGETR